MSHNPLGKTSDYPERYAPEVLFGVPRADGRGALGIAGRLPFVGEDIWNAWELTWLDATGKPVIATATMRFAIESEFLVESKSLKLYLNGFANEKYGTSAEVESIIRADLAQLTGAPVRVDLLIAESFPAQSVAVLPGTSIDTVSTDCQTETVDPSALLTLPEPANETLHSHLLRSLCPVTGQPDTGSISIRYEGPKIDPAGLLRYIVSFRRHTGFHEACVEQIFVDLMARCHCERLSVYARYNRRGGIDINPYRSNVEGTAENSRLWRQ